MLKNLFKSFLIFFAICDFLGASETITNPLELQLVTGFFESEIKLKTQLVKDKIISQNLENLKFIKSELNVVSLIRSIYLKGAGAYCTLGKGSFQSIPPDKSLPTRANAAYLACEFGYQFYLLPYHYSQVSLLPKFGYSYSQIYVKQAYDKKTFLKQHQRGPYLGAALFIKTRLGFCLKLSYDYLFLTLWNESQFVSNQLDKSIKIHMKHSKGYGHNPVIEAKFDLTRHMSMQADLSYLYVKLTQGQGVTYLSKQLRTPAVFHMQKEDFSISFGLAISF